MACRRYRNRCVGEYLKEFGLTEGRNTAQQGGGTGAVLEHFEDNPESTLAAAQVALGIPIATLNSDMAALKENRLLACTIGAEREKHGRRSGRTEIGAGL